MGKANTLRLHETKGDICEGHQGLMIQRRLGNLVCKEQKLKTL